MIEKKRYKNAPSKLTDDYINQIKNWIDNNCSISLNKILFLPLSEFNLIVSKSIEAKAIKGFNYTLNNVSIIPVKRNNEANIIERLIYSEKFNDLRNNYADKSIIFIDETGFNVSMRSSKGRALMGRAATTQFSTLRARNIYIFCAINKTNVISYEKSYFAYNSEKFKNFINNLIIKLKSESYEKFIFVIDYWKIFKNDVIRDLIYTNNYELLFLSTYSPFLNPIENMFSKWKNYVKRENPADENELFLLINNGSRLVTRNDLEGYFKNMSKYISKCSRSENIID